MDKDNLKIKYKKEIESLEDEIKRIDEILLQKTKELTDIIKRNKEKEII